MVDIGETFNHNDVQVLERECGYDGFFRLEKLRFRHRLFAGGWSPVLEREMFVRGAATCVLLYDPARDQVVLVEQFRVGALKEPQTPWLLEMVAGIEEEGETPESVAHREAEEEAGCHIEALLPICNYLVSPGGACEKVHLLCGKVDAQGVGGIHGLEHEGEDIRVHVVGHSGAMQMIESGRINNAATIIALQWLYIHKPKVHAAWLPT